jgi:hypothetical protein
MLVAGIMALLAAVACGGESGGSGSDEAQIRQLNEDAIDYLKQERWSKIYDLYSQEFRDRCSHEDFVGDVVMAKAFLGENEWKDTLKEAKVVATENIQIQGDTATAEVTSYFMGEEQTATDYYIREDGKWRLAPAPGTEGCYAGGEDDKATPAATPPELFAETPRPSRSPALTVTPTPQATAAGPTGQSRGDPIPLGHTLTVSPGWDVTVINVNPDAWSVVQAANTFNEPPEEGYRMVLATLRVVNVQAEDKADTITGGDFELVGSRNQVYKTFDRSCGVTTNDLSAELFPQGMAEGTVCFQAGADETGLLLIASLTWDDEDRRYFALE